MNQTFNQHGDGVAATQAQTGDATFQAPFVQRMNQRH